MFDLSKEIIFITGASSGFGEATAMLLAKHGAKVIIQGRNKDKLQKLANSLPHTNVHFTTFDVSNKKDVDKHLSELPQEFQDITVLINNAGLALGLEPAHECQLSDWEVMIDTNIKGVLYCTHTILPGMIKRNNGYIINIGSTAGNYPYPGGNVYGGTKAFLKQLSLNLRADLLGTNIRVTNLEPGMANTNFSNTRFKGDMERASKVYENLQPLTAQDIAETILWCITRPKHMNINRMEIMPTCQASGHLAVSKATN
jgi:3-hydroxy acid dehydrogenase/malonic semialdehyde reductase